MPRKKRKGKKLAPGLYLRERKGGGTFTVDLGEALRARGDADTVGNRLALAQVIANAARKIAQGRATVTPDLPAPEAN